jgi:1,2-diacylglycerol 3-beta-galactosyltransferase
MNNLTSKKPHIVFYFSDTGGGHRSAAEAIIEAVHLQYSDSVTTEMIDFLKNYAPIPLNKLPDLYPQMVKATKLWEASFYATDGSARTRLFTASFWPYVRHSVKAMVKSHPADLIVSVHFLATTFILKALGKNRPPFYTVVTDMATTHAIWFDKRADCIFVPTEMARQRAIAYHVPSEKIHVVGLPVMERYTAIQGDKHTLRRELGWPQDKFIVLLVGGAEGMGPLAQTAYAIDQSGLDVVLVIVTGRNANLKTNLEKQNWESPTFIYGFTHEMPEFMRAADALVSKAGPGTLAEALNAALPIIMYSKLPGQEDGNVAFIEKSNAGVYAPTPELVVRALTRLVCRPNEYKRAVENARMVARPHSARTIAQVIGQHLRLEETQNE